MGNEQKEINNEIERCLEATCELADALTLRMNGLSKTINANIQMINLMLRRIQAMENVMMYGKDTIEVVEKTKVFRRSIR